MEIEALVETYVPNAMTDHSDDGTPVAFDATILKVVSPAPMRGRRLTLFHDRPASGDSPWRHRSARLRFVIDDQLIDSEDLLFAGAATDLRRVEES